MKRNQNELGQAIINEGRDILKEMGVLDEYTTIVDTIRKHRKEKNKIDGMVTEITAMGLLMSSVGDIIFTNMLDNVENDITKIMALVRFVDKATKWNTNAITYVGDNSMNPNVKREVATFISEVEPNGGL